MNNLKGLTEEINIDKEILSTLPQNNIKNRRIYSDKVEELSEKYNEYEKDILKEVEKRAKKYDTLKVSDELIKSNESLKQKEDTLYLLEENSPFEKMGLDKEILDLTFYYRKNLKRVNDAILYAVRKIEEAGIKISAEDFNFNKYVNEYVSELLKGHDKEVLNSKFEQIYWKCPEIITYIELNIRYIYFLNEKKLIKYYKDKKDELLKSCSEKEIQDSYAKEKEKNIELHKKDKSLIVNKFLSGTLQEKDYTRDAILDIVKKMSSKEITQDSSDEEINEILVNLIKFLDTLKEYREYLEFKFIIDDIKKIFNEGKNYKQEASKLRKEIEQIESKILKLNKKSFFKNKEEKNMAEQNKLVEDLKQKYKELDKSEVSAQISEVLNDHSSLYDAIHTASLYYKYLFRCLIEKDKDIEEEEINNTISKIREYLRLPNLIILNNIELNEDKDIMLIIKDRYNLLNINVTREDLNQDSLESMIKTLEKCELYYYIKENKIDLSELTEIYDFKKILENN